MAKVKNNNTDGLTPDTQLQEQNAKLQNEVDELKALMQQMVESQKSQQAEAKLETFEYVSCEDDFYIDDEVQMIQPNKLINITSLFYGGMTLQGANNKQIRFEKFGVRLPVTFEDLTMICSNHRALAENGSFFIHNKDAIKAMYLTEQYKKFVNKQTIEDLITLSDDDIKSVYNNVTDEIKETMVDIVINGVKKHLLDGDRKYSNRDKIDVMSKLCGKDIYKIANSEIEEEQQNK